jgi:hypothetical protein
MYNLFYTHSGYLLTNEEKIPAFLLRKTSAELLRKKNSSANGANASRWQVKKTLTVFFIKKKDKKRHIFI